ncbi:hypothetical protein K450DRAFT_241993 [Umbelopsis ramanniana AG]|uniref:Uncharacterized protein n=1 Tax=Umbelopsis ramanniana AG TaxID=1314678 RepID=A0AAD5HEB3_UMBRA|nr:uncharacterized protein K450DRAFT_241993 [Umbelopsis ramanniana AG]KAI8579406.1 hypothetical protein K450DRAFT_241993 [Umbelopsis ramanniana AG]
MDGSDPALCKEHHSSYVAPPPSSTPAVNSTPVTSSPQSMQEIPQPPPAMLHRNAVEIFPTLQSHHNESGYSVLTSNSEVSILPMYTPPTPSTGAIIRPMTRTEVDLLRTRYEEHHAKYLRHRKTYVIALILIAIAAMILVLVAFMVSSPHIVLAVGIVLVVMFVCMIHRMTVLRDVVRRERALLDLHGDPYSPSRPIHRRQYPLPDDHFLVITETSQGQERRTLISGPPEYDTATAFPPAYLPKNHQSQGEPMEERTS